VAEAGNAGAVGVIEAFFEEAGGVVFGDHVGSAGNPSAGGCAAGEGECAGSGDGGDEENQDVVGYCGRSFVVALRRRS